MSTPYVALLRAINVGGHVVPMSRLKALFEGAGMSDVSTFIASGNVLFSAKAAHAKLEAKIEQHLADALGYEVATFVRTPSEIASVARAEAPDGASLYVAFLKSAPSADAKKRLAALQTPTDKFAVRGREVYWTCFTRFSESPVTGAKLEKAIGVATSRNITTVRKLAAKLGA